MNSDLPETATPARPPEQLPLEQVLERVAAQVLRLAIPDSPFGVGGAATDAPISTPQVDGFEPPLIEVPPVVEPVAQPPTETPAEAVVEPPTEAVAAQPTEPAPDPGAETEQRIAALRAAAPLPVAPVVLGSSRDPASVPAPEAAPAERPAESRPRTLRVHRPRPSLRRVRPPSSSEPSAAAPRTAPHTGLSEQLIRAGETQVPHDHTDRPVTVRPATTGPARVPARDRPMLAPTGLALTGLAPTGLTAAPVPETRPLTQNRRLYRRVVLAAELTVNGAPCRLIDLSIGGFAAAGAPKLAANAVVPVTLRMNIDGIDIGTQFSARVVYASAARAAGRFIDLTAAQTAFLRYIVTWRGEAIGAIGTTNLLNAITRWPERAFQPHPSTAPAAPPAERQGWWTRWFGRIPLLGRRRP
ncbi:MAG TPA: hypothetical protein VND87_01530 [Stellaceae bacterium]|nr:hypothetical protein [Stellaceae bacterium]